MKKWLSRHVVVNNIDMGLSIVTLSDDCSIAVKPFDREESHTIYTDKTILINNTVTPSTLQFVGSDDNLTKYRQDDIGK